MTTSLTEPVQSQKLQKAFDLMRQHHFAQAEKELQEGVSESSHNHDKVLEALFQSGLGVLNKLKGDFKTAWRYYEKAEKLLPEDPALKIISSRLLIDVFGQVDTAIKKAEAVLRLQNVERPLKHQAEVTLGMAHLKESNRKKAVKYLEEAMANDFAEMVSAENIDLKLLEGLLKKNWGVEECKTYLQKAIAFATGSGEERYLKIFQRLLEGIQKEKEGASKP